MRKNYKQAGAESEIPKTLGRYRIDELGRGAMGAVIAR
jgi:hypothetical protein